VDGHLQFLWFYLKLLVQFWPCRLRVVSATLVFHNKWSSLTFQFSLSPTNRIQMHMAVYPGPFFSIHQNISPPIDCIWWCLHKFSLQGTTNKIRKKEPYHHKNQDLRWSHYIYIPLPSSILPPFTSSTSRYRCSRNDRWRVRWG
jgi:hypothetical protein